MDQQPELLADYACVVGEGPLWHPDENRVYWIDIDGGRMFRYDCATGRHEQVYEGQPVGGFTIQEDGALLLFGTRGSIRLWRDGQVTTVVDEIPDERESRFNDVIADPAGRVFCGTMPSPDPVATGQTLPPRRLGRLYRLDPDGTLTIVLEDVGCSNGMGFTRDRRHMYYTDSDVQKIYRFDYDASTGALTNQQVFVDVSADLGLPDGMTVDDEEHVWSANWDGGVLLRYAPDGEEVMRIPFPAKKVSCVTFGGPDYGDMYVTTAGGDQKATEGAGAGALFRLGVGVRGRPEFRSRIRV